MMVMFKGDLITVIFRIGGVCVVMIIIDDYVYTELCAQRMVMIMMIILAKMTKNDDDL